MQVATGTVVNGKIVLEGVSLPEGAVVTVVARDADESFSLTEAQENEFLAAMAEIDRGEYVILEGDPERAAWSDLSAHGLARAYGDCEPEY